MAVSSPIIIAFNTLPCVKKKRRAITITMLGISNVSYEAPVSEPIVQNLMSLIELLSPKTAIMKFEKAENKALTTVPANMSLVEVIFPLCEAIKTTKNVAMIAPKKEPSEVKETKPKAIVNVAPKVAPEETPSMYGSAIGLLTVACMIVPQTAKPAPAKIPNKTLGTLIFQIMAIIDLEIPSYNSGLLKIFPITTAYISKTGISTAPKQIAKKKDKITEANKITKRTLKNIFDLLTTSTLSLNDLLAN